MAFTLNSSFLLVAIAAIIGQVYSQDFSFDCNAAPTVCDTHCFAFACGGIQGHGLHYDPQAGTRMPRQGSTTTTADFRRQAIGCVNSNPCGTSSGTSCDELPYASTYDGGVGCFPDGYTGGPATDLFMQGVTHCTAASDNSAHGALLLAFYNSQNIQDSQQFGIMLQNPTTFCTNLGAGGACPDEGVINPPSSFFQSRSAPDNTFCPQRGIGTRALVPETLMVPRAPRKALMVKTADGKEYLNVFGNPVPGNKVWSSTVDPNTLGNTTEEMSKLLKLDPSAFELHEIVAVY